MCVWSWLTVSAFATVATGCRSAAPGVCLLLIATSRWPCSCLCDPLGFTKDWAVMLCPFGTLACQRPWQGSASNHACCPMLCGAWECLKHGAASSRTTVGPKIHCMDTVPVPSPTECRWLLAACTARAVASVTFWGLLRTGPWCYAHLAPMLANCRWQGCAGSHACRPVTMLLAMIPRCQCSAISSAGQHA